MRKALKREGSADGVRTSRRRFELEGALPKMSLSRTAADRKLSSYPTAIARNFYKVEVKKICLDRYRCDCQSSLRSIGGRRRVERCNEFINISTCRTYMGRYKLFIYL